MVELTKDVERILHACQYPEQGLPEEVFLMISALVPLPNVDLLILDRIKGILLSWRDDPFFEKGWSVPGGCLRFGESMMMRLQATAQKEIGQQVNVLAGPLTVRDAIRGDCKNLPYPRMRGHNIAVPFLCRLTKNFNCEMQKKQKGENGYLQWFRRIPSNILPIHHIYDDLFRKYGLF